MTKIVSEPYKVFETTFEPLVDRINIIQPRNGPEFSAKLKKIQGNHLVFERRNGTTVIIHEDDILSISELAARRP